MIDRIMIDSNIWIYALTKPKKQNDLIKRNLSLKFFEQIIESEALLIVTIQIINECHYNFINKFTIEEKLARRIIKQNIIKISTIVPFYIKTYYLACNLREKYTLSYWDSLIIASAIENNCNVLYSEDMQHNQVINDTLKIVNPFIEG